MQQNKLLQQIDFIKEIDKIKYNMAIKDIRIK